MATGASGGTSIAACPRPIDEATCLAALTAFGDDRSIAGYISSLFVELSRREDAHVDAVSSESEKIRGRNSSLGSRTAMLELLLSF